MYITDGGNVKYLNRSTRYFSEQRAEQLIFSMLVEGMPYLCFLLSPKNSRKKWRRLERRWFINARLRIRISHSNRSWSDWRTSGGAQHSLLDIYASLDGLAQSFYAEQRVIVGTMCFTECCIAWSIAICSKTVRFRMNSMMEYLCRSLKL